MKRILSLHRSMGPVYVAEMVTDRIYQRRRPVPLLKEHRKAKGVSAAQMAGRLGIERESVHRQERQPEKITDEKKAAWAAALELEPEDLNFPPGQPSVDAMLRKASPETVEMIRDIATRMVANSRR